MERGLIFFCASALVALACSRPDPEALDRADLKNALAADVVLDRTLQRADEAARNNDDIAAADILKRNAFGQADDAAKAADALAPRSVWGRREKGALVALVADRKIEVGKYEHALRGEDLDEKLGAVQRQLALEKRAAELSQEIERGP